MPARTRRSKKPDAIALLKADHSKVSGLFERFGRARNDGVKERLAGQICDELEVHTQVEEQVFYPAVREAIGDEDLMDEATVEHQSAKALIAQIKRGKAGQPLYDAKVTVLAEYIKHHVKEEHTEMFPKARNSEVDLEALAQRIAARKRDLKKAR